MGLGSEIRYLEKTDPGSRGHKDTGSRICNTGWKQIYTRLPTNKVLIKFVVNEDLAHICTVLRIRNPVPF